MTREEQFKTQKIMAWRDGEPSSVRGRFLTRRNRPLTGLGSPGFQKKIVAKSAEAGYCALLSNLPAQIIPVLTNREKLLNFKENNMSCRRFIFVGLVMGVLAQANVPSARAQGDKDPPRTVQDDGEFFSQKAKLQANETIARIRRDYKKDLFIETLATLPLPDGVKLKDKNAAEQFVARWAANRFKIAELNGVYVLFVKDIQQFRIEVGSVTARHFTKEKQEELKTILLKNLRAGQGQGTAGNGRIRAGRGEESRRCAAGRRRKGSARCRAQENMPVTEPKKTAPVTEPKTVVPVVGPKTAVPDAVPRLLKNLGSEDVGVAARHRPFARRHLRRRGQVGHSGGECHRGAPRRPRFSARRAVLRRESAAALGSMKIAKAAPGLKKAMDDEDVRVAIAAAVSLGNILPLDDARAT